VQNSHTYKTASCFISVGILHGNVLRGTNVTSFITLGVRNLKDAFVYGNVRHRTNDAHHILAVYATCSLMQDASVQGNGYVYRRLAAYIHTHSPVRRRMLQFFSESRHGYVELLPIFGYSTAGDVVTQFEQEGFEFFVA
jgi:hypothetical protein